jgi:phage baseplate assembly protein W
MTDFGTDIDVERDFALSSGRAMLVEALRWRLSTPRGALFYDADYGLDLRAYCNESMTESEALTLRQAIAAECLKDSRVATARADVVFNRAKSTLAVSVRITDAAGPFAGVFSVDSAAVRLLERGSQ